MDLHILPANFNGVVITAFDLFVDVEFCGNCRVSHQLTPKPQRPWRLDLKSCMYIPHFAFSSSFSLEPCTMLWRRMLATSIAWLICMPVSTAGRRFFSKVWRASWRAARRTGRSSSNKLLVKGKDYAEMAHHVWQTNCGRQRG